VQQYFRPGDAGNFNFYGYSGRIGYSDRAGKPGTLTNPGNSKDRGVDVHQIAKEADAERHAVGQSMPAWPAGVRFFGNVADSF
jgi:hypothetical protein